MEEHNIQLEMKISYLEKDVNDLSDFVRELSDDLSALRKKVGLLQRQLLSAEKVDEVDAEPPE